MKNLVLFFCAVALCFGYEYRGPSPEEVREWKKVVETRYDLRALTDFLRRTVSEVPKCDDVELSSAKLDSKWEFSETSLKSGEWRFFARDPKKNEFTLCFYYQDGRRMLGVECVREGKNLFRVVKVHTTEVILLTMHERQNQPNKAPEPTPVAVMPRAISRVTEMKPQSENRSAARVTPATGVAHL